MRPTEDIKKSIEIYKKTSDDEQRQVKYEAEVEKCNRKIKETRRL